MIPTTGFHVNRLAPEAENPREVAFHDQWVEENDTSQRRCLLYNLVPDCADRDAQVAATIIQWLGSNVGFSFLHDALSRAGYRITPEVKG